jgi:hypothetical protein
MMFAELLMVAPMGFSGHEGIICPKIQGSSLETARKASVCVGHFHSSTADLMEELMCFDS